MTGSLLQAQASDWGPWIGGDGIKTSSSKPDVGLRFDPTLERKPPVNDSASAAADNDTLQQALEQKKEEKFVRARKEHEMLLQQQMRQAAPGAAFCTASCQRCWAAIAYCAVCCADVSGCTGNRRLEAREWSPRVTGRTTRNIARHPATRTSCSQSCKGHADRRRRM